MLLKCHWNITLPLPLIIFIFALDKFKFESGFSTWLTRITINRCNELPRSRAARYQKEFSFNPDAEHRGILLIKTYQEVLEQAEDMLGFLGHQEQAWLLRYGLLKEEIGNEKIASKRHEIESHIENLNRMLGVQQSFQTNLQSQITAVENRISEESVSV